MFPDRLWLALGSGQRLNEGITGVPWPDKPERNARLGECAAVIRALLAGETVTHRGLVTVVDAKLYSRPERPPMLLGAGGLARDGGVCRRLGGRPPHDRREAGAAAQGGGRVPARRRRGQADVPPGRAELGAERGCCARGSARAMALSGARRGPELGAGLPEAFDAATRFVRPEDIRESVLVSADPGQHAAWLNEFVEIGFSELYLHQIDRNQETFMDAFAAKVLPELRS
jgi:alkanesulfonate monooxygenase SsuD/methylene tetrahydromethanopterin reductase-like flavin-dependent oxidoreductase (luciferase family)